MRRKLFTAVAVIALGLPIEAEAVTRRMFVTSETGSGDLSTWPSAGGQDGLAGADSVCRTLATGAGLPRASTYVAWMSDATTDAYCRVHGLTGTKETNCGQATLPKSAGPWVRTDGNPFGGKINELLDDGKVVLPAVLDEDGNPVAYGSLVFTGTDRDGTWVSGGFDCSSWSSSSGNMFGGRIGSGAGGWSSAGSGTCGSGRRLACFDPGTGTALPPYSSWGRLAFLSSANGPGNFGEWSDSEGVDAVFGADLVCQHLADRQGIPDSASFKAWLSNATTDAISRFQNDGPWMRLDGVRIADGRADLVDGTLAAALDVTERGDYLGAQSFSATEAWTGTLSDGTRSTNSCANWKSSSSLSNGFVGSGEIAIFNWTQVTDRPCNFVSRIYCLSDLPLIFGDGFEGGSVTNWSLSTP